ncbi:hypothetical protein AB5N19_01327 [Seiridium cardinale]|uniref:GMPS ATP-PPase domain-containing protein n=1 Tax=Seiridium cardinale TaxID=138064 RepID=A0ABR2X6E0_9PEZI
MLSSTTKLSGLSFKLKISWPKRHNGPADKLFEGLQDDRSQVWMSHGGKPSQLPNGFSTIATTQNSPYAGITHEIKHIYGIQFYPDAAHTLRGTDLLKNSAVSVCGAQQNRKMSKFIGQEMIQIRNPVGDRGQVIGAVSGGVDSTVAARVLKEATGD